MDGAYTNLLRPLCVGEVTLKNRIFMAPMTRIRSDDDHTPNDLMKMYFMQRAGYGLVLTDPTMVQRNYSAFGYEPGIYSREQVAAWKAITDTVHAKGGVMFLTLSHGGRVTTPSCLTSTSLLVMGPSRLGVPAGCTERRIAAMDRAGEAQPFPPTVHRMTVEEVLYVKECFVCAARNAMAAGFDGVAIDAAHGYLVDQFLRDGSNDRNDEYGGSIENRCRFLLEIVDEVAEAIGSERVSVRLSPASTYNGVSESDPQGLLAYVASELDERRIAFLQLCCEAPKGAEGDEAAAAAAIAKCGREHFEGPLVLEGGHTPESAEMAIRTGAADAVAFGKLAVANADLAQRLAVGAALNSIDWSTVAGRGAVGYVDYPLLEEDKVRQARQSLARSSTIPGSSAAQWQHVNAQGHRPTASKRVDKLLQPMLLHRLPCMNRMVMGPFPRQRADTEHNPTPAMVKYYADRSSMGLIVSEPVEIQPGYHTYTQGPSIVTKSQMEGWKAVVDAVHESGGVIFCQLHHGGRAVAACNIAAAYGPSGKSGVHADAAPPVRAMGASTRPVDASILCPAAFTKSGREEPYAQEVAAMHPDRIQWLVKMYAIAARKAIAVGFDGVEVQASNGYLIDQFLRDGSNDRTDEYGGSIENRCRFLLEVVDAVIDAVGGGAHRVGVRVSPTDPALDMKESNVPALCRAIAAQLHQRDIAYLAITNDYAFRAFHLMRPIFHRRCLIVDAPADMHTTFDDYEDLLCEERYREQQQQWQQQQQQQRQQREIFDAEFADLAPPPIERFAPDAVSFALEMVANPDMVDRAVHGIPLRQDSGTLLFTHGEEGYNDYLGYKEERRRERMMSAQRREEAAAQTPADKLQTMKAAADGANGVSIAGDADHNVDGERVPLNSAGS